MFDPAIVVNITVSLSPPLSVAVITKVMALSIISLSISAAVVILPLEETLNRPV